MHPNPKRIIPVLLILALAALAWWYFRGPGAVAQSGELTASGTIEATQVTISPEFGGKVADISVQEGQEVQSGQELVRIEDKLLQAQLDQAKVALAVAQANYDLVAAGPTPEQRQLAVAAAELEVTQAQQAVAAANKQLVTASERLDNLNTASAQGWYACRCQISLI